jgi:DNA replication protein DnaC
VTEEQDQPIGRDLKAITARITEIVANRPQPTPEELARQAERERKEVEAALESSIWERTPRRYRDRIQLLAPIEEWVARFLADRHVHGLILLGRTGSGKTHQLFEMQRRVIEGSWPQTPVHYFDVSSLLRSLRPGNTDGDVFTVAVRTPLLLLDDLGANKASEWTEQVLFEIINERYMQERPVVLASNVTGSELASALGERVASRLVESCEQVVIKGKDRRRP